ncbi:MAG: acetate/propionate family kinase [Aquificaceae bacterium]|nr:acetate/propionate family kinase [Aquificaceae bacterium]MDW8422717.1 acetate/propionate family kinase [Aquificaceae bacterium]
MRTFLCLNYGSSSLKYALFEETKAVLRGSYECRRLEDFERALEELRKNIQSVPCAVAHRVVHGMEHTSPMPIREESLKILEELAQINPLHNAIALKGIKKSLQVFPESKHFALFDTDFHRNMPPYARIYGIDYSLYQKGIKRYGFHGLSYSYLLRKSKEILQKEKPNLIMMHLGQGCSLCAVKDGLSVETSMGFSPLEGLLMVSRPGDIDAGILLELLRMGYSPEELNHALYYRSGLSAMADVSNFKELLAHMDSDNRARLAFDAFIHRLLKYVGAYWFLLQGKVDALVFSGGIGENSWEVRKVICEKLSFLRIEIDNNANRENKELISTPQSPVKVLVLKTDEELEMVLRLLEQIL